MVTVNCGPTAWQVDGMVTVNCGPTAWQVDGMVTVNNTGRWMAWSL